jgi:4-hydroxy-tetrahydrodipicolinate synthase
MVPILTPLTPDERVDEVSLRRLVSYLIDNGVHGIWAAGTTGEFAALADDQRLAAIETVVDEVAGRVPVIGNISAASTGLAVDLARSVRESGLDGIAATPPYYYSCSQGELLEHYRRIKDRSGAPLWVYNIPSTVKTVVEPATIARLAAEGTVVGVKDSSGAGELLAELNALCEQGGIELYRFLGSVYRIASTRALGAHGVITGVSNLAPAIAVRAWEAGEAGDGETARECMAGLMEAGKVLDLAQGSASISSRLSGLKSALKLMGILEHDTLTMPLRSLADEERQPIPAILKSLGLLA